MSVTQAIGTANILQNKIGMSLGGVTNLLAPPERSDTLLQAGASTLAVPLLAELKELQNKTYECVEKVANILQTQLDIAARKKIIIDEHSGRILVDALLADEQSEKMTKKLNKLFK